LPWLEAAAAASGGARNVTGSGNNIYHKALSSFLE
jgi:hypothetical protein